MNKIVYDARLRQELEAQSARVRAEAHAAVSAGDAARGAELFRKADGMVEGMYPTEDQQKAFMRGAPETL